MTFKPLQQRLGRRILDGLLRTRPAIKRDEEALDRLECTRSHQHRVPAATDDPLQIAAKMPLRKIGVLAAFADDDEIRRRIKTLDGIHERSVLMLDHHTLDAGMCQMRARIREDGPRLRLSQARLSLRE
jgi:hypothetical protein